MKKFLLETLIIFLSLCSFASEETLALIDKTQKAHEAQSEDVKSLYEELAKNLDEHIESGTKNANIHTMQGNAYLHTNKVGMAIYAYKNALKFEPNNDEILNNLNYAQSLCKTQLAKNEKTSLLEDYFFNRDFTKNNALWIFLLSWNLIFIIPLLNTKITEIKFLWFVSIILALVYSTALLHYKYVELTHKEGIVKLSDTIARKGASDIFIPAYKETLKDGTEFIILGEKNNWLHAKLKDGSTCWLDKNSVIEL